MSNYDIAINNLSDDWKKILITDDLKNIINSLTRVTPGYDKIFEFARLTKLSNVKVVILGQDPYPKAGDAHGLSFSCLTGIPGSLKNIYKCLYRHKLINVMPDTGNLDYWASQGVLLLNTALTTETGTSNKHAKIWKDYTTKLIEKIASLRPLIFMLWGNHAMSYEDLICEKNPQSIIYKWSHPSPLQTKQSFTDFCGFLDTNKVLIKLGHEPIDWNTEPPKTEIEIAFDAGPKTQVAFTDGSCMPNNASAASRGGYASTFVLGTMKDVILYGNIECDKFNASNQRAEGTAILRTLMYLKEHTEWEEVIIVTDSEFWINMIEKYMPSWSMEKFKEKKNSDLTLELWNLYNELLSEGKTVQFRHVKSHDKDGWSKSEEGSYQYFCYENNKYIDELASYARKSLNPGEHIISSVTYE